MPSAVRQNGNVHKYAVCIIINLDQCNRYLWNLQVANTWVRSVRSDGSSSSLGQDMNSSENPMAWPIVRSPQKGTGLKDSEIEIEWSRTVNICHTMSHTHIYIIYIYIYYVNSHAHAHVPNCAYIYIQISAHI